MTPDDFLLFFDPLPEAALLLSGDGTVLVGNRAVGETLGIALDELRGRKLATVVSEPADDVARYLRLCSRNRKPVLGAMALRNSGGGVDCRTEGNLVRPKVDGADALLLLRLVPKQAAVSQFTTLNGRIEELGREVVRRRKAEEEAREQEERLRVTLQSIGDAVITTDAAARVTDMNAVAEKLTGWATADAVGRPLDTVFRIVNEGTRRTVENPAVRALTEGVIVGLANHTILIRKNGTEVPIDDSAAPIRTRGGEVVGCVLVFRDITERHEADKALRHSEEFNRGLMDGSVDCIKVLDVGGRMLSVNPPGLCLMEIDDFGPLCGREWSVLWPADAREDVRRAVASAAGGDSSSFQAFCPTAKGTPRWWDVVVSPVRNAHDGRVVRLLSVSRDITDRKRAEEELRRLAARLSEADRRKDEFLATLAHELRNPLAPIRNGLQVIRMAGASGAVERARSMMDRQLTQLVRLVDDLLDVSRITRGKLDLRRERVDVRAVIESAVETSRPAIEQAGHDLAVTVPDGPLFVDGDAIRLAQVVSNLLTNSAKYTHRGGHISLAVRREGGVAVVSVRDDGIGIPPAMLDDVFQMFTQVDRTLEKTTGGLGIGLSLVKGLVEMHGGTIEARSEGEGRGSEFVVTLPVATPVAASVAAVNAAARAVASPARRVLVVDDNADAADSLAQLLELLGHEVRTANDGEAGVVAAAAFRPAVVLMDIGMPKLNGYEAARRIRAQPWGTGLVLVALTGWGQDEDRQKSSDAGFDIHLTKPVETAALMRLLAGLPAATA